MDELQARCEAKQDPLEAKLETVIGRLKNVTNELWNLSRPTNPKSRAEEASNSELLPFAPSDDDGDDDVQIWKDCGCGSLTLLSITGETTTPEDIASVPPNQKASSASQLFDEIPHRHGLPPTQLFDDLSPSEVENDESPCSSLDLSAAERPSSPDDNLNSEASSLQSTGLSHVDSKWSDTKSYSAKKKHQSWFQLPDAILKPFCGSYTCLLDRSIR